MLSVKKGPARPWLVDTHVHLDLLPLSEGLDAAIERAWDAGVVQMVTIGIDAQSSRRAVTIAEDYENVYAAVGIHPHDAAHVTADDFFSLEGLLAHPKVVAIGEIGLDYAKEFSPRHVQQEVFVSLLDLARRTGLPVVIHDREAHDDILACIQPRLEGLTGVFHCYSGDENLARRILDLGFYVSITGIVTFPKADILRSVVGYVPLDRLLIETDSPYLSPVPFRGRPNEPARVALVAEAIARIRNIPFEEVASCTSANARALFRLPSP